MSNGVRDGRDEEPDSGLQIDILLSSHPNISKAAMVTVIIMRILSLLCHRKKDPFCYSVHHFHRYDSWSRASLVQTW